MCARRVSRPRGTGSVGDSVGEGTNMHAPCTHLARTCTRMLSARVSPAFLAHTRPRSLSLTHAHTHTHTHTHTSGSPLIVPWDDAAAGYALLGIQTSQPVAGPAAFLRASELLPWILSVPRLGENPSNVMRLEIKDVDIPGLYIYIYACMHACMYACMQTYVHAYTRAYMHTCIHEYMHTCIHAYMRTCIHAYIHTYTLPCMHTYMPKYMHTYMHTCIHMQIIVFVHGFGAIGKGRCR